MTIATAFYPSLSYGSGPTLINFGASDVREVASLIEINEAAIRKQNVAEDGTTETLFLRFETQVRLSFQFLTKATIDAIRTWWRTHAALGQASGLTLDRLNTAAGQLEYDTYNTLFTTAELVDVQWQPRRTTPRGLQYALSLTFRQGTPPAFKVRVGSLWLTGYAPTVRVDQYLTPASGGLTLTGLQPTRTP
jgi:hypothetical protein